MKIKKYFCLWSQTKGMYETKEKLSKVDFAITYVKSKKCLSVSESMKQKEMFISDLYPEEI